MNVPISVLLQRKGAAVHSVPPHVTVFEAVAEMNRLRIGAIVILDQGRLAGIFTERDVLKLCAEVRTDFAKMSIRPYMTCDMTTGKPSDTVSEVLAIMTTKRFRHMPVVEDGKMVGVVSIGDLVKAKLEETAFEAKVLREYITT